METEPLFRILAVCTGNVCRSPLVERTLQSGLDSVSPGRFTVSSAGTRALVGRDMTPQVAGFVRVLGGSDANFESRQLTPQVLRGQNLVLALTRQHRSDILELAPTLLRRTFTLREFARMVDFVSSEEGSGASSGINAYERWEKLLPRAASIRHEVLSEATEDDILDPYRRQNAIYQEMMKQVSPAVQVLMKFERKAATV